MANRIKGITVEIGGDTTGLENSLKSVNDSLKKTQSQLKDVETLLKLDPSNVTLLAQKQELLTDAIEETEQKLEALESAQESVTRAFESGNIGRDQYLAFQREVEDTRGTLNRYRTDLSGLQSEQERLRTNTDRLTKLFDATGKTVDDYADVLGSRLVAAIKNGTANSDQLKAAIEKIGKSATGGRTDLRQLTDAIDTVDDGQAIRNLINELNEAGDAAQNAADDVGEIAEATKGAAVMEAADQLSVVGDKIQQVGGAAVEAYSEAENAVTKVNAYFGETGTVAEASAQVVKDVYAAGVGDSMESVADAVIMVKKNLGDLSDTDLTNLTQQALTLDQLYGIDMNETLRGVNALMKQYGLTAQEAMDYIVKGTQNGLDKTNELGDNLSEYSGKFAQAGYSASEYFQLLENGLAGGAYNLDKVNDAINEVTTRLADGTIADSIGLYSTKTQELFLAWQNGSATQKQVIDSIVSDIANCTSEQDALNMAAQAFGTMAEDGNLKFITSLTSVGSTYDSVKGSAQGMFDATLTPMQQMEANTRQLQQSLAPLGEKIMELANTILPPLVAAISTVSEWFSSLPGPIQNFIIILGALMVAFTALAPVIAALAVSFGALNISLLPIIAVIAAVAAAIAGIIAIVQNWGAITEWFGNLWQTVSQACMAIWQGLVSFFTETIPAAFQSFLDFFSQIPQWWSNLWSTVASFFTNIWANIQNAASSIWSAISNLASSVWNGIKNTVVSIATGLKDAAVNAFQNLVSGIGSALSGLFSVVSNGFSSAISFITGLPGKALQWGKDFIGGLINGIKSMIGAVVDTVSGIASKIASFLHFSAPDEGPLSDYETWMPDFMQGLAKGIERSRGLVSDEISKLTKEMDLEHAIPGMEASISAMPARNSGSLGGTVNLSQPIYLDGKAITTLVSQIQYSQGQAAIRNLGTA